MLKIEETGNQLVWCGALFTCRIFLWSYYIYTIIKLWCTFIRNGIIFLWDASVFFFPNQSPKSTWRFIYNVYVHQYSDFTFQLLSMLIIFSIIYNCVSFHDGPDIRNWCKTLGNRFVFSVSMWQPVYKPQRVYLKESVP